MLLKPCARVNCKLAEKLTLEVWDCNQSHIVHGVATSKCPERTVDWLSGGAVSGPRLRFWKALQMYQVGICFRQSWSLVHLKSSKHGGAKPPETIIFFFKLDMFSLESGFCFWNLWCPSVRTDPLAASNCTLVPYSLHKLQMYVHI